MEKFKNIKKKEAALLVLNCLLMSSAHAMDTPEFDDNFKNLKKTHDEAAQFYNKATTGYISSKELEETLHVFYGSSHNNDGLLNNLWESKRLFKSRYPGHQQEIPGGLQALANRMTRTDNLGERKRIRDLHLGTLQYVTKAVLQSDQDVVQSVLMSRP